MSIDNDPLVLVADDLQRVIDSYKYKLIKHHKLSVVSATTLEQLDEVFDKFFNQIDIIILDGCMPGDTPNTIDFIVRARERGFTKPIIAASSMPEYRKMMRDAGCSHESEKPLAPKLASDVLAGRV